MPKCLKCCFANDSGIVFLEFKMCRAASIASFENLVCETLRELARILLMSMSKSGFELFGKKYCHMSACWETVNGAALCFLVGFATGNAIDCCGRVVVIICLFLFLHFLHLRGRMFVCKNARDFHALAAAPVHDGLPSSKVTQQGTSDALHVQCTQLLWLCGVATNSERHILSCMEHWLPAFNERGVLRTELSVVTEVRLL